MREDFQMLIFFNAEDQGITNVGVVDANQSFGAIPGGFSLRRGYRIR
jgi:hypothetical protein